MNVLGTQDTTSAGAGAATQNAKPGGAMGKDEFLKLLVAQLSNQDPMNPMEGQEFAAQLAQFSSVEQLISINEALSQSGQMNGLLAQSINSGVAAGLIGKNVQASGNGLDWSGEGTTQMNFSLAATAKNVTVSITNEQGQVVRTLELGGRGAGKHTIEWDGVDNNGATVGPGAYTYSVKATDADSELIDVETFVSGRVDRITFGEEGILLWLGNLSISMQDVESVE